MTEQRKKHKGPPVMLLSLTAFLVVLAVLAIRMSRGEDPAVGAGKPATATAPARRVLVRRIVKRVVVTHVIPPPVLVGASPRTSAAAAAPVASAAAAPARASAPAPVAAAPAPVAAAPAPAPAPAPVTRSS